MGNGEPTTREKLIGVWSNYYLGTYEFCPDGTFMYEVENSGYYLFGNWTIEGGDLVIYYEGDFVVCLFCDTVYIFHRA